MERPPKRACTRTVNYADSDPGSDSGEEWTSDPDFASECESDSEEESDFDEDEDDDDDFDDDFDEDEDEVDDDKVDDDKERREALSESSLRALKTLAEAAGVVVTVASITKTSSAISAARSAHRRGSSISQVTASLIGSDSTDEIIKEARAIYEKVLREAFDDKEVCDTHFGRGCPVWLRNLRSDLLYACILEQTMNAEETRAATEEVLLPLPAEIGDNIKKLMARGGVDWVDRLSPSFVRVIGAAFTAVDKEFADPDIEALRSLARDTPTSDPKSKSKNRIFGYPLKDAPPNGHVRVTLAYYALEKSRSRFRNNQGIRCIVRGFVPSSTLAKDVVKETVESAKNVGLGDGPLLDKALTAKFAILNDVPSLIPIGNHNMIFTDDTILAPRAKVRVFAAEEDGVNRRWSVSIIITTRLVSSILFLLQTTRDDIEKKTNVRAVVEPGDIMKWRSVITPCDKTGKPTGKGEVHYNVRHKPLRAYLKNIEKTYLDPREGDDILSVWRRLRRLARRPPLHILIKETKGKGEWTPRVRDGVVKSWKFKKL